MFREGARVAELVKTIIDEGADHHSALLSVRALLAGLEETNFLRTLTPAGKQSSAQIVESLAMSNDYYAALLRAIDLSFRSRETTASGLIVRAVRSMRNMHEINVLLAESGVDIPFDLPKAKTFAAISNGVELHASLAELDAAQPGIIASLRGL